uniref:tRNA (guanine(10)-N(2))-methyltransferase TRMT11 n=1 Tax=Panagrolaimus davidi TaxID=227884 RepID=A0A914QPY3_9BILA
MRENSEVFEVYNSEAETWKFQIRPQGKRPNSDRITELRERFTPLLKNDRAPVSLENPKHEFTLIEDFLTIPAENRKIYFGRKIGDGQYLLKSRYNLKDRKYIGNSTMDPELAFIQANLIHAQPNSIILDPFSGTGGLLIPAAHFGSTVIGTEINYMVARGEGKSARQGEKFLTKEQNVALNFKQYNLQKYFCDIIIGDASRHGLWRESARFDAIIADPPYGIREKGRIVGNKVRKEHWTLPSSAHDSHYPEKTIYSLNKVFLDLLNLSAARLAIGGRVAFWFPVLKST